MLKFLISTLTLISSLNANAWTSVAFGRETSYVYADTSELSRSDSEKYALEGCAKRDNDCVISLSATGKDVVLALVRYDGGIYTASRNSLKEAENTALKNCRAEKHKNCYLKKVYFDGVNNIAGVATVNGEGLIKTLYSSDDKEDAMQKSLDNCKKISNSPDLCKSSYYNDTVYVAFAYTNNKEEKQMGYAASATKEGAEKLALEYCEESGKRTCSITQSYRSSYIEQAPKEIVDRMAQLDKAYEKKQQALNQKEAKKPLQKLAANQSRINRTTCENSCYNGSCIRTLPDGTKEKWQAPMAFDPFSNSWTWDTNTNACGI